jgi:hypothetical protein
LYREPVTRRAHANILGPDSPFKSRLQANFAVKREKFERA